MLFTRYSDVSFLFSTMNYVELVDFLVVFFERRQEDVLRELWLSNPFRETTFQEFKKKTLEQAKQDSLTKDQKEAQAVIGMTNALEQLGMEGIRIGG